MKKDSIKFKDNKKISFFAIKNDFTLTLALEIIGKSSGKRNEERQNKINQLFRANFRLLYLFDYNQKEIVDRKFCNRIIYS